jgi:hypothetical protein
MAFPKFEFYKNHKITLDDNGYYFVINSELKFLRNSKPNDFLEWVDKFDLRSKFYDTATPKPLIDCFVGAYNEF